MWSYRELMCKLFGQFHHLHSRSQSRTPYEHHSLEDRSRWGHIQHPRERDYYHDNYRHRRDRSRSPGHHRRGRSRSPGGRRNRSPVREGSAERRAKIEQWNIEREQAESADKGVKKNIKGDQMHGENSDQAPNRDHYNQHYPAKNGYSF